MPNSLSERLTSTRSLKERSAVRDCLILQYRRVALLSHDPLRLAVQPCHFEKQMEYLATNFHVISMKDLQQHLETATPFRDGTVAVTFDGGYSDVLYTAKEVLERFEVPATVFVPSAHLMERTRFWWDVLEDVLIAGDCQGRLVLELDDEPLCWPLTTQHDRFRAFEDLYALLSEKPPCQQREIVAEITRSLDGSGEERDNHATLSIQELRKIEEGGLITIGGHSHNCTKLSSLCESEQMREIGRNKQILEEILGHGIEYFAYPFGDQNSYTTTTTRLLRGLGFTLSCRVSSDTVCVTGAASRYELPRITIRDWNPFTFYRCLTAFFGQPGSTAEREPARRDHYGDQNPRC